MASSVTPSQLFDHLPAAVAPISIARLFGLWVAYRFALCLYNISPFHPLYRFPGPRLAAMSYLYEAWFDFWLVGRYTHEIKKMHARYGPIVRINPEELHCNDPNFTDEIYPISGVRTRDKHYHFLNSVAGPVEVSAFGTKEHEVHRRRRNAVSRFFSRTQMLRVEPEVHQLAQKMCDKLLMEKDKGPVEMIHVYNQFTADTISQYAYGTTFGFLDEETWKPNFKAAFEAFVQSTYVFRYMPIVRHLARLTPFLSDYLGPDIARMLHEMNVTIPGHIIQAQNDRTKGRIFTELIDSALPEEEKTIYRLSGEGWSLISAGTETTAATLSMITYHLLSSPQILARLARELKAADLDTQDHEKFLWTELEKQPYLHGVVYEGIRLSYGVSQRLSRVPRDEDLRYENREKGYQYLIPRGTPVGMSSPIAHHDEDVFPDSYAFRPERWILEEGQGDKNGDRRNLGLKRYIMSFSQGSRRCMGMNLALCELHLVTALMAIRVFPRMTLYDTTFEVIDYDHDKLTPQPKVGARGVRVLIS